MRILLRVLGVLLLALWGAGSLLISMFALASEAHGAFVGYLAMGLAGLAGAVMMLWGLRSAAAEPDRNPFLEPDPPPEQDDDSA